MARNLLRVVLNSLLIEIGLVLCLAYAGARAAARVEPVRGPGENSVSMEEAEARIERIREGDAVINVRGADGKPLQRGTEVSIEQTRHKFLFGSNIFMLGKCRTPGGNAAYAERFAALFNYATAPFYWWMYEPVEGQPNYQATEPTLTWCRGHGVTVKGHPLAWNFRDPAWIPRDPSAAMKLLFARVGNCVSHFKGEISYWDVVNEATEYGRPGCRRDSPVLTSGIDEMGVANYLRTAFTSARDADPAARLVINDYRTEDDYADKVISKLTDNTGVPLYDVIGIQCHQHRAAWPPDKIWEICERFAKFGKPLHFTETTILSGELGYELLKDNPKLNWETMPEGERRQAEEVARFYTILFSHPAVEAITWWDLSDQGAWQGAPAGLLRQDMSPKPAYDALMKLIKGKWWTRTQTKTVRGGEARFRGFYGDYKISVKQGGRELTGAFSFDKSKAGRIEVRLR